MKVWIRIESRYNWILSPEDEYDSGQLIEIPETEYVNYLKTADDYEIVQVNLERLANQEDQNERLHRQRRVVSRIFRQ